MNAHGRKAVIWLLTGACVTLLTGMMDRVGAQEIIDAAPADLDDFHTLFRNPAALPLLSDRLVFGTGAGDIGVNPGAFDVRNGFAGYHGSFGRWRVGLNGRFLDAGIFRRTEIGLSWGQIIQPSIAIGARLDIRSQGFDRERFEGIDPGDPVLAAGLTRNYASLSIGVLATPAPGLSVGAVVENFNRPDVSLTPGATYRLPVALDLGVQFRSDRFHPSINVRVDEGAIRTRLRMGVVVREDDLLRVDLRREQIGFEGIVRIYRGVHVDYRYDYPLNELNTFSRGSHALSFVYDFAPRPVAPEPLAIRNPPPPVALTRAIGPVRLEGDYRLLPSASSLEIREERITRRADPDIPVAFLRRNYAEIFGDPGAEPAEDLPTAEATLDSSVALAGAYSPGYRRSLDSLAAALGDTAGLETIIYTGAEDLPRAENLREFIGGRGDAAPRGIRVVRPGGGGAPGDTTGPDLSLIGRTETRIVLSSDELEFRVVSPGADGHAGPWRLVVLDRESHGVHTIEGRGPVPNRIAWDWRRDDGTLIDPGWYTYRLQWESRRGEPRQSPPGRFHVRRYRKDITIELTRKRRPPDPGTDRLELRLGR